MKDLLKTLGLLNRCKFSINGKEAINQAFNIVKISVDKLVKNPNR